MAMGDAIAAAGALRDAGGDPGSVKRVVAAADLEATAVVISPARPGSARSLVGLQGPVPLRRIVSLHVDEEPGGDDDLLWYDVTELEELHPSADLSRPSEVGHAAYQMRCPAGVLVRRPVGVGEGRGDTPPGRGAWRRR